MNAKFSYEIKKMSLLDFILSHINQRYISMRYKIYYYSIFPSTLEVINSTEQNPFSEANISSAGQETPPPPLNRVVYYQDLKDPPLLSLCPDPN